jgi:hypothetical protein
LVFGRASDLCLGYSDHELLQWLSYIFFLSVFLIMWPDGSGLGIYFILLLLPPIHILTAAAPLLHSPSLTAISKEPQN